MRAPHSAQAIADAKIADALGRLPKAFQTVIYFADIQGHRCACHTGVGLETTRALSNSGASPWAGGGAERT